MNCVFCNIIKGDNSLISGYNNIILKPLICQAKATKITILAIKNGCNKTKTP